jgi:chromosome condensin MukBEF MukE localization factor
MVKAIPIITNLKFLLCKVVCYPIQINTDGVFFKNLLLDEKTKKSDANCLLKT